MKIDDLLCFCTLIIFIYSIFESFPQPNYQLPQPTKPVHVLPKINDLSNLPIPIEKPDSLNEWLNNFQSKYQVIIPNLSNYKTISSKYYQKQIINYFFNIFKENKLLWKPHRIYNLDIKQYQDTLLINGILIIRRKSYKPKYIKFKIIYLNSSEYYIIDIHQVLVD